MIAILATEMLELDVDAFALTKYGELARRVLEALLDKYADAGVGQIEETQVLTVAPFTQFGTPLEIVRIFGGTAQYQEAIRDLKRSLYTA